MSEKLTKQGVRDLDAKYGRAKSKRVELPPSQVQRCSHPADAIRVLAPHIYLTGTPDAMTYCSECGQGLTSGQGVYEVTWEEVKFNPLNPKTPRAHVDAFIQASGGDRTHWAEDGQTLAMALLATRKVTFREWAALIPLLVALKDLDSDEGRQRFVMEGPRAFVRVHNLFTRLPQSIQDLANLDEVASTGKGT